MTTKLRAASFQDNAVTTAKIAADAVTAAKIPANAIGSSELDLTANYAFTGTLTGTGEGYSIAHAKTTTNRSITGVSSWIDHLAVTFTTTKVQTLQCIAQFSHGWENGEVMLAGRFDLDGSTQTTDLQVFKQGHGSHFSHGSHNLHGFFTNVSAGSHTVTIQVKNYQAGTEAKMNYFDNADNGDNVFVLYS
jgi:hypothetical protein